MRYHEHEVDPVQVDLDLFGVHSIPSQNPNYRKALDGLCYQTPTGIVTKNTGELILLRQGSGDERTTFYDPQEFRGQLYVSLEALRIRFNQLTYQHTREGLRQPITHSRAA